MKKITMALLAFATIANLKADDISDNDAAYVAQFDGRMVAKESKADANHIWFHRINGVTAYSTVGGIVPMSKGWHDGWLWAESKKATFTNKEDYVDRSVAAAKSIYPWDSFALNTTFSDAVATWCDLNEKGK